MKALLFTAPNTPLKLADIDTPVPGPGQLLVRSVAAGLNPVDSLMYSTGLLVTAYPVVLGCDASGTVAGVGAGAQGFAVGDRVCGCTRLGSPGYGTWGEFFLMDAELTIKTPGNVSDEQAAALGVGSFTASLGLFAGLDIPLPSPASLPGPKDEWLIVFSGAGSVGQYAVQMAKACGYKVLATCSAGSEGLLHSLSASATVDYTLDPSALLSSIKSLTGGSFSRAFDAGGHSYALAAKALSEVSTAKGKKYFTTIDDWSPMEEIPGTDTYRIGLGPIGRDGQDELNGNIKRYIPAIEGLVEKGVVVPNKVEVVGEGFDRLEKVALAERGAKGGKKGVVILGTKG